MIAIGYDIGGTSARAAAFDAQGSAIARARRSVRGKTEPGEIAEAMRSLRDELLGEAGLDRGAVGAVGVGLAAQLGDGQRLVRNAPNLGWRDVPFASIAADALGHPVHLANDLSALLWGEKMSGALRPYHDALVVFLGTGVGAAMMCGGQLLDGAGGVSGEIGHVKVEPGGRLCGCGERGCLEAYAGGVHLEEFVRAAALEDPDQLASVLRGEEAAVAVDLAEADRLSPEHEELGRIFDRAAHMTARAIANACTLLNPGALLLGGGVWANCANLRAALLRSITPLVLRAAREDLRIVEAELGDGAGVLGAAMIAREREALH